MALQKKQALICGVAGQDGSYLANLLLHKGYRVAGTSRDAQVGSFRHLKSQGVLHHLDMLSMSLIDFRSVIQVMDKVQPDEIYNLAGQSSVGLSFGQPVETLESHALGALNLLEAIRFLNRPIRLYNACSGECFGDTGNDRADENTPFHPRSPYAVAKATAFWEIANYREAYGLHACSGILFNHESPLRPERFVTQKIVVAACRIARGSRETLSLGNLDIRRDWGWALEYVDAMWRILQQDQADDYVIATGESHTLKTFVAEAFDCLHLDWHDYVKVDKSLFRPSDIMNSCGNAAKAERTLGWRPAYRMKDVVRMMVEARQGVGKIRM